MAGLGLEVEVPKGGDEPSTVGVDEASMGVEPQNNDAFIGMDNRRDSVDPELWDRDDSRVIAAEKQGTLIGKTKAKILRAYNYLIRLRGSPEEIAWGLAIGLFIAMTPTVGLQMMIAVPIATALRGNPAAAAAGCWLTNPFTIPFMYGFNYWLGATLLGYEASFSIQGELTLQMLLDSGSHVWWSLILGGVITGLGSAALAYYPTIAMVRAGRAALSKRRERRRARRARRAKEKRERDGSVGAPIASQLVSPVDDSTKLSS